MYTDSSSLQLVRASTLTTRWRQENKTRSLLSLFKSYEHNVLQFWRVTILLSKTGVIINKMVSCRDTDVLIVLSQ